MSGLENARKTQEELQEIIKRLEIIRETMHPHEARHIDEAILQLEYHLTN